MNSNGRNNNRGSVAEHWNKIYSKVPDNLLGWYEKDCSPSLHFIEQCKLPLNSIQFHAGAGTGNLLPILCELGFKQFIINDISPTALEHMQQKMLDCPATQHYLCFDLTNPAIREKIPEVDLWHDRAVFHFFTDQSDATTYFETIRQKVKLGGYAVMAAFHKSTVSKCSGLHVHRYDEHEIAERLGKQFSLIDAKRVDYTQPSGGKRVFVYALFRKSGLSGHA